MRVGLVRVLVERVRNYVEACVLRRCTRDIFMFCYVDCIRPVRANDESSRAVCEMYVDSFAHIYTHVWRDEIPC